MAIYHMTVKIVKRSEGRSVVAAAAYRAGERIESLYDGIEHDYTRKGWIEHSAVLLPENAPEKLANRAELWNAVEQLEKSPDAQLAREVEVAIPIELPFEKRVALVESYIKENFTGKGMIADYAIHNPPVKNAYGAIVDEYGNPTKDPEKMMFRNPHAHILLTMRPLDDNGNWAAKSQKWYVCVKDGKEMEIPPDLLRQAEMEGWKRQYHYKEGKRKVWLTKDEGEQKGLELVNRFEKTVKKLNPKVEDWSDKNTFFRWRESWASTCNQYLKEEGLAITIDHRSYEEQGINKVPGVHLSQGEWYDYKKGVESEKMIINKEVEKDNTFLERFQMEIERLEQEQNYCSGVARKLAIIQSEIASSAYLRMAIASSVANDKYQHQRELQVAQELIKETDNLMKALEVLEKQSGELEEQIRRCNPIMQLKKKNLVMNLKKTEKEIQDIKSRLHEIRKMQEQAKKIKTEPNKSELQTQQEGQVAILRTTENRLRKEFYDLVSKNKEHMNEIRTLLKSKESDYEEYTKKRLKTHQGDKFNIELFEKAKLMVPKLEEEKGMVRRMTHG